MVVLGILNLQFQGPFVPISLRPAQSGIVRTNRDDLCRRAGTQTYPLQLETKLPDKLLEMKSSVSFSIPSFVPQFLLIWLLIDIVAYYD